MLPVSVSVHDRCRSEHARTARVVGPCVVRRGVVCLSTWPCATHWQLLGHLMIVASKVAAAEGLVRADKVAATRGQWRIRPPLAVVRTAAILWIAGGEASLVP